MFSESSQPQSHKMEKDIQDHVLQNSVTSKLFNKKNTYDMLRIKETKHLTKVYRKVAFESMFSGFQSFKVC